MHVLYPREYVVKGLLLVSCRRKQALETELLGSNPYSCPIIRLAQVT